MMYKMHITFSPFREECYYFECYEDVLEFLDTLSIHDDLFQVYISKVRPDWYNMTEAF